MTAPTGPRVVAGTTPYAWPWHGSLDPRRTALLVVTPAVGPAFAGTEAGDRAGALAAAVHATGGRVIHVVTLPPRGAVDERPVGWPDLDPIGGQSDDVIVSAGIDGFYGSRLDAVLRQSGCDLLLLTGVGLETCVHSTMRSANDRGLECLLVLDACVAYSPELVVSARSQVEMSGGIFGAVGNATDVLAALDGAATSSQGVVS